MTPQAGQPGAEPRTPAARRLGVVGRRRTSGGERAFRRRNAISIRPLARVGRTGDTGAPSPRRAAPAVVENERAREQARPREAREQPGTGELPRAPPGPRVESSVL